MASSSGTVIGRRRMSSSMDLSCLQAAKPAKHMQVAHHRRSKAEDDLVRGCDDHQVQSPCSSANTSQCSEDDSENAHHHHHHENDEGATGGHSASGKARPRRLSAVLNFSTFVNINWDETEVVA